MNKANVFLLVVVSSLLTYISTATQPAATAAVAQEKWEYGMSHPLGRGRGIVFRSNSHHYSVHFFNGELLIRMPKNPKRAWESQISEEDSEDYKKSVLQTYESIHSRGLWEQLGDEGWHPYQVIQTDQKYVDSNEQHLDIIYWRRRVQ